MPTKTKALSRLAFESASDASVILKFNGIMK